MIDLTERPYKPRTDSVPFLCLSSPLQRTMLLNNVTIILWDFTRESAGEEVAKLRFKYIDNDTLENIINTWLEESDALYDPDMIKCEVTYNYLPIHAKAS